MLDIKEKIKQSRINIAQKYRRRTWSQRSSDQVSVMNGDASDGASAATAEHAAASAATAEHAAATTSGGCCPTLHVTVEPLLFALIFIHTFSHGVLLNLLERNVCVQKYGLTAVQCSSEEAVNATMKSYLEGAAAQVNLAISLIQGLCPVALSLFVGPWSDNNGRKPFILLPFAGYLLYYLLWALISLFPNVPIRYMLLPSVPLSLTGGLITAIVCCYCYLCDVFPPENRTFRFNIAMSAFLGGGLLANLTVSRVFAWGGDHGYALVFLICSAVAALSLLYTWLHLNETKHKVEGKGFLFSWENAKSVFTVILMRPTGEMIIILLTVVILVSEILLKSGEGSVEFLVGKSQFNWTLNDYTRFSAFSTVIAVASSVVGSLVLKRLLGLENATVILVSAAMLTAADVLRGLSTTDTMFWLSSGLAKTGALVGPTIAAEMSNVVSTQDLGKVYAFNAMVDSGSAYLSTPVYTSLYKHLLTSGRSLHVYLLSAALAALVMLAAVCLKVNNRRYNRDVFHVNKTTQ